jgi:hypothetical protein
MRVKYQFAYKQNKKILTHHFEHHTPYQIEIQDWKKILIMKKYLKENYANTSSI